MKKKLIIIFLLVISVLFLIQKITSNKENNSADKPIKEIDFHNYPVKEDHYHTRRIIAVKKPQSIKPDNKINTPPTSIGIRGNKIPDWVYNNTTSSDNYYNVIHAKTNVVFYVNYDELKNQTTRSIIKRAINKANVSNKFTDMSELHRNLPTKQCNKFLKENLCIMDLDLKDGLCQCAVHYLLDSCKNNFCIINPQQRRIIYVPLDVKSLALQLNELRNW